MNRLHGLLRKCGTAIKFCGQLPSEGEPWVVRSLNLLDNAQHTDQTINAKKPDVNGDNNFRSSNKRTLGQGTDTRWAIKQDHVIVLSRLSEFGAETQAPLWREQ